MELQFLGTGAGVPSKMRNVTSIALKLLDEINEVWLFDCGEATQQQILNTNIRPGKIKKIFITHMHGDHIFGLPGLLTSRSFQGGEDDLTLYGPKGIKNFIDTTIQASCSKLGYPLKVVEFEKEGLLFEDKHFKVEMKRLEHGIPSYGFRVTEKDQPGELQADRLKELGIPFGPLFGKLKKGETQIKKKKKKEILAYRSDVLVHEATYEGDKGQQAYRHFHSTSLQAAEVAKNAEVKRLLLTHISARYLGKQSQELEDEAKKIFENVQVVKDFDIVNVERIKHHEGR